MPATGPPGPRWSYRGAQSSSGLTQSLSQRPHVACELPHPPSRGDRLGGVPAMPVVAVATYPKRGRGRPSSWRPELGGAPLLTRWSHHQMVCRPSLGSVGRNLFAQPSSRQEEDVARLDVGSQARILAEGGDRRQCCNLLTALDDEGLVPKGLADRCRLGGGVVMRTGQ